MVIHLLSLLSPENNFSSTNWSICLTILNVAIICKNDKQLHPNLLLFQLGWINQPVRDLSPLTVSKEVAQSTN